MIQQFDLLGQIEAADGEMTEEVQLLLTLNENEIETTTQLMEAPKSVGHLPARFTLPAALPPFGPPKPFGYPTLFDALGIFMQGR